MRVLRKERERYWYQQTYRPVSTTRIETAKAHAQGTRARQTIYSCYALGLPVSKFYEKAVLAAFF